MLNSRIHMIRLALNTMNIFPTNMRIALGLFVHTYNRVAPGCTVDLSRFPANEWRRSVSAHKYSPFLQSLHAV